MMKTRLALILFFNVFIIHSYAQTSDYDKGLMAFDAKDFKQVVATLKPYAEKGNCLAQYAVGFSYMYDNDIRNVSLARHWLKLSAEQKLPWAMGPLAACYFTGDNTDDIVQAYMWAVLAQEYDPIQRTTTIKTLLEAYLKPAELEQSKKLIQDYKDRWKNTPDCK
jgi:TPR repeat protein